jgi:hypothetical protein
VVRPEETTYFDPKDKQKKSTTIWALSLEVEGEDMRKLVSNLTENAHLFAESRKLLGDGQVLKVIEEEKERAQEFVTEFYGDEASPAATSDKAGKVSRTNPINEPQQKLPAANQPNPRGENQKNPKPTIREPKRKPLAAPSNNTPGEASPHFSPG